MGLGAAIAGELVALASLYVGSEVWGDLIIASALAVTAYTILLPHMRKHWGGVLDSLSPTQRFLIRAGAKYLPAVFYTILWLRLIGNESLDFGWSLLMAALIFSPIIGITVLARRVHASDAQKQFEAKRADSKPVGRLATGKPDSASNDADDDTKVSEEHG